MWTPDYQSGTLLQKIRKSSEQFSTVAVMATQALLDATDRVLQAPATAEIHIAVGLD
jgi:hypothetical protein